MRLEVFKAGESWSWHVRSGGNIGPAAHGYNTKAKAQRALENHFIAVEAFNTGHSVKALSIYVKKLIRQEVRAKVVEP